MSSSAFAAAVDLALDALPTSALVCDIVYNPLLPDLLVQAKAPAASKSEWDLYDVLERIPGASAFPDMATAGCPLIAH